MLTYLTPSILLPAFILLSGAAAPTACPLKIDADYPGGNIRVDRIDANNIYLRQDIRDTETGTGWFSWNFRVHGAEGQTLTFHFIDKKVIGTRGPAVSRDEGRTWAWLGTETVQSTNAGARFSYTFTPDDKQVRFAFPIPYLQADLDRFLARWSDSPDMVVDELCKSRKGRSVERLRICTPNSKPRYRLLLTCRHHARESIASYLLEGTLSALLADTEVGRWFRENVETIVIPFVDKDGVEDGDQGKNRIPHDHGRDYGLDHLYPETRALCDMLLNSPPASQTVVMDLHCPGIRGKIHEVISLVGNPDKAIWDEQCTFGEILETTNQSPLPYKAADNLSFGQAWNTDDKQKAGMGLPRWAGKLPGVRLATTLEIPYANAGDATVTPETARAFGADMTKAIRQYLEHTPSNHR